MKQREFGVQVFGEKKEIMNERVKILPSSGIKRISQTWDRKPKGILGVEDAEKEARWANSREALKSPGRCEMQHPRLPILREEPWEEAERGREVMAAWCFQDS